MPDERWVHVPEHGVVYEIDPYSGEPVVHHPVAMTARHGARIARLPALERLVRGFVASHDQDQEWGGQPPCECDLCTEGRTLLGLAKPDESKPKETDRD